MTVSKLVMAAIALVMIVSIIELSFVSATVGWVHATASGTFAVRNPTDGTVFAFRGVPLHFLVNQGHTSNGAAGTAFVLVGLGGILALWLRNRAGSFGHGLYYFWLLITILSLMLTIAALGYVMNVTIAHRGQAIDAVLAASLPPGTKYPYGVWAPQNWFSALLDLDLAVKSQRSDIASHLRVTWGWQYNLIPMMIIQLAATALFILDGLKWRKQMQGRRASVREERTHLKSMSSA